MTLAPTPTPSLPTRPAAFTLLSLVDLVLENWLLLALVALAGALAGGLAWMSQKPVYVADALIQVERQEKSLDAALGNMGAILAASGAPSGPGVAGEIELIRSRMILGRTVDDLHLDIMVEPRFFPLVGKFFWYRHTDSKLAVAPLGLNSYAWGGEHLDVTRLEVAPDLVGQWLQAKVVAGPALVISTQQGEALGTCRVGLPCQLPRLSLFVRDMRAQPGQSFNIVRANHLSIVENFQQRLSITERGRQSSVIGISLAGDNPRQIVDILNQVANLYVSQNVERKSEEAGKRLEFLKTELPNLKQRVSDAEEAINDYRRANNTVDISKEAELLLQESATLQTSLLGLQQKRDELLRRFQPGHPQVRALDDQIDRVRGAIGRQEGQIRGLPPNQQELLRLQRDFEVSNQLYLSLLNNTQQLQVARAGTIGNVRVIDFAEVPPGPVAPIFIRFILGGLVTGLGLGLLGSYLRQLARRGLEDPARIEQLFGLPVISSVPFSSDQRILNRRRVGNRIFVLEYPSSVLAESLRGLRAALHFTMLDAPNNRLMVTGPAPGLGKSFLSVNFAAILAQGGRSVVVIDADLRRGTVHRYVDGDRVPGVSDFVAEKNRDLESILRATALPNLKVIAGGKIPPSPTDLLMHERFRQLLEEASSRFDLVIVDVPPVLAVADFSIIGAQTGTILGVLKSGKHTEREISQMLQRLEQVGLSAKAFLLNQVHTEGRRYGQETYAYQYKYRSHST